MKGWIKVHEHDNEVAIPMRAIQTVQAYEYEKAHGFVQTNAVGNIYFDETYEEVLALIEEAESEEIIVDSEEKLQAVIDRIGPQSDFYKGMALIKGYCSSLKNCKKCPLNGYRECPLKLSGRVPERWDLDNLYLTADTEEEAE